MIARGWRPILHLSVLSGLIILCVLGWRLAPVRAGQLPTSSTPSKEVVPQTESICAGRFTLHLPTPISGGFSQQQFNNLQLSWQPLHEPEAAHDAAPWKSYVDRLREEQGKEFAKSRIVKDYMLDGRQAVFYRFVPTDDSPYTLETWTVYGDQVLASSFDGRGNDLANIEQVTLNVLHHFVLTSEDPILGSRFVLASPDRELNSAFCVQGGAIRLPPDYGEQLDGSWSLPQKYDLDFSTVVYTIPTKINLVKKTREAVIQSGITPGSHLTVVRAGDRTVLGMVGQESVVYYRNAPEPAKVYTATFQYGGSPDKASMPGLKLTLSAYDRSDQKVDVKDFVATWDSILQTMEVRLKD